MNRLSKRQLLQRRRAAQASADARRLAPGELEARAPGVRRRRPDVPRFRPATPADLDRWADIEACKNLALAVSNAETGPVHHDLEGRPVVMAGPDFAEIERLWRTDPEFRKLVRQKTADTAAWRERIGLKITRTTPWAETTWGNPDEEVSGG